MAPPRRTDEVTPTAVERSAELFAPVGNDVELCYQTFGDSSDEPLVLIMGLGGPMTWWDPDFCERLARVGFFVVRFDNRDTGRSSRIRTRVRKSQLPRAFLGRGGPPPYTLADMAGDVVGLLDHLGLESTHVVGVSMGGMIAQTLAITAPTRVRSLTSIMSSTGKRTVGWQHPSMLPNLMARRGSGKDAYVTSSAQIWARLASPGFPTAEEKTRARAEETFDRGVSNAGVMRQMLAILNQPNRSARLRGLQIPAAVIHGLNDPMVHNSGGRATAAALTGAELVLIEGMGHDMPEPLWDTFVETIRRTADRAGH